MNDDIAHFVKVWVHCQVNQPLTKNKLASCNRCLSHKGHGNMCMDLMSSSLESQGYDGMLVMVDLFAKLVHTKPIVETATA